MQGQDRRTLGGFDGHEAHAGTGHGFADCLGVGGIILVGPHIGLNELRGHKLHRVSQRRELPSLVMGTATGLHTDQAGLQVGEERENLISLKDLPEHHLVPAIHPMNRKNGLCEIHSYRCNLHCRLLPVSGTSHAPLWHC